MSPLPGLVPGIVTGNIQYKMLILYCFQQHDYIVILNKCVNVWISQLISGAVDVPRQYANVCGRRHTYFIHFVDFVIYNEILGQCSVLFSDSFDNLLCGISKFNFSCCREVTKVRPEHVIVANDMQAFRFGTFVSDKYIDFINFLVQVNVVKPNRDFTHHDMRIFIQGPSILDEMVYFRDTCCDCVPWNIVCPTK